MDGKEDRNNIKSIKNVYRYYTQGKRVWLRRRKFRNIFGMTLYTGKKSLAEKKEILKHSLDDPLHREKEFG
jgi:hypothetical protein